MEAIREFFSSPEFTALISSIVAFFSANLVTIILFAVKYIKLKAKEAKEKMTNDKVIEDLNKKYQEKIELLYSKLEASLNRVENTVTGKIQELDEAEKKMIEDETITLNKAMEETNKSIDDILADTSETPK